MSRHVPCLLCLLLIVLIALSLPAGAAMNLNSTRYDRVHVVPAPGPVTLDGDLKDWDRSGEFYTYRFEEQKDSMYYTGGMMYDAQNLYIAAHVGDSTPMMNMHDPATDASFAWAGDCLQVRISSDPKLGWPLTADTYGGSQKGAAAISDNIIHLTMWYYTAKQLPCIQLQYGMDYHGLAINPDAVKAGYKKDADNRGYTMEYAIPWKLLNAAQNPPRGGDELACTWQMLWGDNQGRQAAYDLADIRNPNVMGVVYQNAQCWGKAVYEKTGNLPKGTVVAREEKRPETGAGFLPIEYKIPGKGKARVSMQVYDAQGNVVRWLLGDAERSAGQNTELWDGLNNDFTPVPPGKYTVKWAYYRGVKGKLLATADNAGQPPYNASDGAGSWAGDYGTPVAVCANDTYLYIIHESGEASAITIKVTPEGRKVWGTGGVLELDYQNVDMCTDGYSLYVIQGKGGEKSKAGVVKVSCVTGNLETFGNTGRSYVVLSQPEQNDGMGTTKPLTAIAVNKDLVFVSSEEAGQVFCIDKQTGKQVRVIGSLDRPRGMAVGPDGKLYVIAGTEVYRMNTDGSARQLVIGDLYEPQRIAVAKNGEIFVSVHGNSHQVLRYAPDGKFINAIGKRGGMLVPGPWVKEAMRRPLGLCIAPDGKLWVAEGTSNPKRTSVWETGGKFVTEYLGPAPYSPNSFIDPDEPEYVYIDNTKFRIDYKTGKTAPVAVVCDPEPNSSFPGTYSHGFARVIHFQGRRFAAGGVSRLALYELKDDRMVGLVTIGALNIGIQGPSAWRGQRTTLGIDRNLNGRIDPQENQFINAGAWYWGNWVDDKLNLYLTGQGGICRLPFEGFDKNGVPIYNAEHLQPVLTTDKKQLEKNPTAGLITFPGEIGHFMVDSTGNYYVTGGTPRFVRGQSYLDKGYRVAKFSPQGKLLWEYRNVLGGFATAWGAGLSKPGEIMIPIKFTGEFGRYITLGSYFGQYHILDKETGLYITSFTPDTRTDPPLDGFAVLTENFNGAACYAPKLGKYLYSGGDTQARVWEVQGLSDIKYGAMAVTVTSDDFDKAMIAEKAVLGMAAAPRSERTLLAPSFSTAIDGDLNEWDKAQWATFGVDEGRKARAAATWSTYGGNRLQVAFDVTDDSAMLNKGGNNNLLFKTGDAVELCLSSADPDIERKDEKPLAGDKRILITMVKDEQGKEAPIAVLYEPKSARADKAPGSFTSPTGREDYDVVTPLKNAQVVIKRHDGGYTVEAQLDAAELGFTALEVGQRLRADFGVLFSDKGGVITLTRAMWADDHNEIGVNNDIPTESRIHPKRWGWLVLR